MQRPRIWGHRGARANVLENTLAGFAFAERIGCDGIELDVRSSADRVAVVIHDVDASRLATPRSPHRATPIAELTAAQIGAIELPDAQHIPTLAEVLAATRIPIQVEIKAREAVALVATLVAGGAAARERITVTSFDEDVLAEAACRMPGVGLGYICHEHSAAVDAVFDALPITDYCAGWDGLTAEDAARIGDRGIRIDLWPVRDDDDLERAIALGVDGVTLDDPAHFVPLLAARRAWASRSRLASGTAHYEI